MLNVMKQVINNEGAKITKQINVLGELTRASHELKDLQDEKPEHKITILDKEYFTIIENILKTGFKYEDPNRKGVERLQIPFVAINTDETDGVLTIRKSPFRSTVAELVLFLQGVTDVREFEKADCKWWRKDWSNFAKRRYNTDDFEEYLQRSEVQEFLSEGNYEDRLEYCKKVFYDMGYIYPHYYMESYKVFDNFKENPFRTDLIVNSWDRNKNHPKTCTLVACHFNYQFVKTKDGFKIVWSQRSTDFLLGSNSNITFYWLMGKILEIWSGHKFEGVRGELHNVHLYDNQFELAQKIVDVARDSEVDTTKHNVEIDSSTWRLDLPFGEFIKTVKPEHFKLKNYKPILNETVEMLAYNN